MRDGVYPITNLTTFYRGAKRERHCIFKSERTQAFDGFFTRVHITHRLGVRELEPIRASNRAKQVPAFGPEKKVPTGPLAQTSALAIIQGCRSESAMMEHNFVSSFQFAQCKLFLPLARA